MKTFYRLSRVQVTTWPLRDLISVRYTGQSINQSINLYLPMQLQANNNKVWQAARTGNSPTKPATLDRKTDRWQYTLHDCMFLVVVYQHRCCMY